MKLQEIIEAGYGIDYAPNGIINKLYKTNFKVGDAVVRLTKPSSKYSTLMKGQITEVTEIVTGTTYSDGMYIDDAPRAGGTCKGYFYVYEQRIKVRDSNQTYNGSGFALVKKGNNVLALDVDRPTFVREFEEVTEDGKVVRKYIGELTPFNNLSAAQVACSNQISASIRSENKYRKFAIFVEKAVAQAKQPEVEFK